MNAIPSNPAELRVCILCSQYFAWGKYGGFGSMARRLAEALAGAGVSTAVVVPRRAGQGERERLNGVEVVGFRPLSARDAWRRILATGATLFHSQDPSMLTVVARWARPDACHLVTCRDPRSAGDWLIEFRDATWGRRAKIPFNYLLESSAPVKWAVRHADRVFTTADFLVDKVSRLYHPRSGVTVLPNLIEVPKEVPPKPARPVLTFMGRLDRRKRPEMFLELARRFPDWTFIVIGQAESTARDAMLRARYAGLPNIEWHGFINRFEEPARMREVLQRTWAIVNTSSREGLPMSFLEAGAYGCAIVSRVDPDRFAARFGVCVQDDDFAGALSAFVAQPAAVLAKGAAARDYIGRTFEQSRALAAHLDAYRAASTPGDAAS